MKARLPQGYGGGGGDMNSMLRQAQKMQKNMEKARAELEAQEFTVTSGGGAVEVKINGKREITSLVISPDAVDPDDLEMLQDMLVAAVNEAIRKVDETSESEMQKATGGMNIPGLF
jgi:DNA-binding YbaB/EbfC family protein